MRRLHPNPAEHVTIHECYDLPRHARADGPWVMLCMVSGLDGSTTVGSTSRGLSSSTDQQLLLTLRSFADVVLVGANTARWEGYGPPRSPHQRVAVVSRTGEFDFSMPIWTSGQGVLLMPEDGPEVPVPSVRAGTGDVDLRAALAGLGATVVQAEGGPTLNGLLAAADLVDELNLTISPQVTGGDGPRAVVGAPELPRRMHLAHVLEDEGFLFTRYLRNA
jgi:riboflavin biosynthesis pyrimidine reductase